MLNFDRDVDLLAGGDARHGGDVWGAARSLGQKPGDILDLSASLNPLGPPPGLTDKLREAMGLICHYPDRAVWELRQALAAELGLEPAHILPGNGSTALIRLLARAMDLRAVALMAPAFGEFGRSLAITGRHFHYVIMPEKNGYLPTHADLERVWRDDPACVIISNPGTPAGGLADPAVLDALVLQASRRRAWVIVDEAFIDFAPEEAQRWSPPVAQRYRRVVVLRSLTKFYCLAGLRLGYAMGHPDTLAELAPLGEPWAVNTLAQVAGIYCLGQKEYAQKTRQVVAQWRAELVAALSGLGMRTVAGQVNYVLAKLPEDGPSAELVADACAAQGVLVRPCANFVGCSPFHLRVAVCPPEEQARLLAVLKPALNQWLFGGSPK
ncbi:MAG: threonine-phosphate decarboxylase [Pseudomonadota bacterium]